MTVASIATSVAHIDFLPTAYDHVQHGLHERPHGRLGCSNYILSMACHADCAVAQGPTTYQEACKHFSPAPSF
jgi:hypothetical protein